MSSGEYVGVPRDLLRRLLSYIGDTVDGECCPLCGIAGGHHEDCPYPDLIYYTSSPDAELCEVKPARPLAS